MLWFLAVVVLHTCTSSVYCLNGTWITALSLHVVSPPTVWGSAKGDCVEILKGLATLAGGPATLEQAYSEWPTASCPTVSWTFGEGAKRECDEIRKCLALSTVWFTILEDGNCECPTVWDVKDAEMLNGLASFPARLAVDDADSEWPLVRTGICVDGSGHTVIDLLGQHVDVIVSHCGTLLAQGLELDDVTVCWWILVEVADPCIPRGSSLIVCSVVDKGGCHLTGMACLLTRDLQITKTNTEIHSPVHSGSISLWLPGCPINTIQWDKHLR